jgi:hypothetical protein
MGIFLCGSVISHAVPRLMEFSPRAGAPGTVITVSGAGFGNNPAVVSAVVGETAATVVSVSPEEVRLNAPGATGLLAVTVDGVNLLEYALGSSPVDSKDAARPTAARVSGPDRIAFTYQKLRADVIYTVEAAATLTGPWSSTGVDQGGAGPAVTASVPVSGGRRFLRLRAQ